MKKEMSSGASERALIDKSSQGNCERRRHALPVSPHNIGKTMSASLAPECNEVKELVRQAPRSNLLADPPDAMTTAS